jgi:hypothetical protein
MLMNTKGLGADLRKGPVAPFVLGAGGGAMGLQQGGSRSLGAQQGLGGGWQTHASTIDGPEQGERGR